MAEMVEVKILRSWDGKDQTAKIAAELRISVLTIAPSQVDLVTLRDSPEREKVFREIEDVLQPRVDHAFRGHRLEAEVIDISAGSLNILTDLLPIGGAVYFVLKDYKDLREGLNLFIEDVKRIGQDFVNIYHKFLNRKVG
jgi:hypothetical protein